MHTLIADLGEMGIRGSEPSSLRMVAVSGSAADMAEIPDNPAPAELLFGFTV
jgi:hypothetical protein